VGAVNSLRAISNVVNICARRFGGHRVTRALAIDFRNASRFTGSARQRFKRSAERLRSSIGTP
jgi:hypothetical protein